MLWLAALHLLLKAITQAGTITDTKRVAEELRALPVEDPALGRGDRTGQAFFGIRQGISFPFGIGMMADGTILPVQRVEALALD